MLFSKNGIYNFITTSKQVRVLWNIQWIISTQEKYPKGLSQKNDFSTKEYSLQHISIHYKIFIFTTSSLSYNHLFRLTWYSYPTKHKTRQMIQANVPVSYEVAVTISAWQWGHLVCTGLSRNCCTMATVGWATTTVVCPYCAVVGCP